MIQSIPAGAIHNERQPRVLAYLRSPCGSVGFVHSQPAPCTRHPPYRGRRYRGTFMAEQFNDIMSRIKAVSMLCDNGIHMPVPLSGYPDPDEAGWTYFECRNCNAVVRVSNQQIRAWTYTGIDTAKAVDFLLSQIRRYHWQPKKL